MSTSNSIVFRLLAIALLGGTAGLGTMAQPSIALAQARSARSTSASNQPATSRQASTKSKFGGFFAPQGRAMPKDSEGGASRGHCLQGQANSQQTVTLLTPAGNSGLTASTHPTFMARVDDVSAKQVFFSLKNADESYFFEMTTQISVDELGLVTFQLPKSAPPLEPGKQYLWSVAAICGSKLGPDSPWASGWIERVENPDIDAEAVRQLPLLQQASHYGQAGLWYDTAASLARYHRANQNAEAQAAWSQLLTEGGLEALLPTAQSLARQ